jgi:hypothetical protein
VLAANAEVAAKLTALMQRTIAEGRSTVGAAQKNEFNLTISSRGEGARKKNVKAPQ